MSDAELEFLPYGQRSDEVNYAIGRGRLNRVLIEAASELTAIELVFDTRCIDVDPGERHAAAAR